MAKTYRKFKNNKGEDVIEVTETITTVNKKYYKKSDLEAKREDIKVTLAEFEKGPAE